MPLTKMERLQDIVMTTVIFSLTFILLNSSSTLASPIGKRSNQLPIELNCDSPVSVGDGLLRDMMMMVADFDHDGKVSETEIAWFYRNMVLYTPYVAYTFGRSFIEIADLDHDNLLDSSELLCMLGAMSASNWTRR
ncbi:uncharacterized protein LOC123559394 isoform X2 [Mercenaria mercenaria]|nr:uncharacterized protein LOC123559394 isoform X2 [Mercenaria mercenaria]